jgi:hypothetical protein
MDRSHSVKAGACVLAAAMFMTTAAADTVKIPPTKYKISSRVDKRTDFKKLDTYAWTFVPPSEIEEIDPLIVSAIDRELRVAGFTKVEEGANQVLVRYMTVARQDVKVNTKPHGQFRRPQFSVATLVIELLDPTRDVALFRVRSDTPIAGEIDDAPLLIDRVVAQMFERLPERHDRLERKP